MRDSPSLSASLTTSAPQNLLPPQSLHTPKTLILQLRARTWAPNPALEVCITTSTMLAQFLNVEKRTNESYRRWLAVRFPVTETSQLGGQIPLVSQTKQKVRRYLYRLSKIYLHKLLILSNSQYEHEVLKSIDLGVFYVIVSKNKIKPLPRRVIMNWLPLVF